MVVLVTQVRKTALLITDVGEEITFAFSLNPASSFHIPFL